MVTEREKCAQCGELVYASDDVCMSCGAARHADKPPAQTPPESAPAAQPRPAKTDYRPPIEKQWYHRLVESCGRMWDIFPWTGLVFFALLGMLGLGHAPDAIKVVIGAMWVIWYVAFFVWLYADVKFFEESSYWIPIAWLCLGYPVVFVVYWFRTR